MDKRTKKQMKKFHKLVGDNDSLERGAYVAAYLEKPWYQRLLIRLRGRI